jgi:predicted dehydrogenase
MRQVLLREGKALLEEVPRPVAGPGQVLVRTSYSVLSAGTERAVLHGSDRGSMLRDVADPSRVRRLLEILRDEGVGGVRERMVERGHPAAAIPGYAAAGLVEGVRAGISDLPPGTAVACAGAGYACHAEWIVVPRNLVHRVPDGLPLEQAAFATLGAIALQAVRRASLQIGECAVVVGLGLIGSLVIQIARAAGARVVGFDRDPERAARCRRLGLEAYDLAARDPRVEVPRATAGLLADAVLVCAATEGSEAANLAMRLCRKKGRVVLVGDVGLDLDRTLMYEKELDLLISTSYGPGRYDPSYEEKGIDYPAAYVRWTENRNLGAFLALLADGRVSVDVLTDRMFPLADAPDAYRAIAGETAGEAPLGVVLEYPAEQGRADRPAPRLPGSPDTTGPAAAPIDPVPAAAGAIGIGLCGAGHFVRAAHLPAIRAARGFELRAVTTSKPAHSLEAARRYAIASAAADLGEMLEDEYVRLILIGTRHHLHATQAREALAAGKHLLVEKPLCLEEGELGPLLAAARSARRLLAVGFNRRYSPLARRAREVLDRLPGPAMAVYRVNAGLLPADHWVHDPDIGGGRIVGECCHFLDLLLHLIDEPLIGIEAQAVPSDGATVVGSDSFAALLTFARGSRATLLYTGLGDAGLEKERVEIFKGGSALVLDDFRRLLVHGAPGGSMHLRQQDKGIASQWEEVARALRGEPTSMIAPHEVEATMRATFLLDRAVRGERCAS